MPNKINQLEKQRGTADSRSFQCWWMLAGVVDYKLCDRDFDCEHCPFDKAIHGGIPQLAQTSEFEIEESILDRPAEIKINNAVEFTDIQEYKLADTLFYHPSHIWMRVEEGCVRVGLDDFGQRVLGRVYSVTLPTKDSSIRRNEGSWKVTHQVGETTLIAPVSGKVKKVNTKLAQYPSLLNREPYGEGWALLIEPTDLDECLKDVFYGQKVKGWYKSEIEKLCLKANEILSASSAIGLTMPDGGMLKKDFMNELNEDEMLKVISSFFPASSSRQEEASNKFFAILDQKRR